MGLGAKGWGRTSARYVKRHTVPYGQEKMNGQERQPCAASFTKAAFSYSLLILIKMGLIQLDWPTVAKGAQAVDARLFSHDTHTQAPLFYALTSVSMAIAIVSVLVRLYIRLAIHKQPGWDDACSSTALLLQIGWTAANYDLFRRGGAKHQWELPEAQVEEVMRVQDYLQVVQMATYLFAKLALLLLYRRLFAAKAAFRWAVLLGCVVTIGTHVTFGFLFVFLKGFEVMLHVGYALAWVDLMTDVYLWVLPLAAVMSLNMPGLRKLGVGLLFSVGLL